jgi:hypothetical protein
LLDQSHTPEMAVTKDYPDEFYNLLKKYNRVRFMDLQTELNSFDGDLLISEIFLSTMRILKLYAMSFQSDVSRDDVACFELIVDTTIALNEYLRKNPQILDVDSRIKVSGFPYISVVQEKIDFAGEYTEIARYTNLCIARFPRTQDSTFKKLMDAAKNYQNNVTTSAPSTTSALASVPNVEIQQSVAHPSDDHIRINPVQYNSHGWCTVLPNHNYGPQVLIREDTSPVMFVAGVSNYSSAKKENSNIIPMAEQRLPVRMISPAGSLSESLVLDRVEIVPIDHLEPNDLIYHESKLDPKNLAKMTIMLTNTTCDPLTAIKLAGRLQMMKSIHKTPPTIQVIGAVGFSALPIFLAATTRTYSVGAFFYRDDVLENCKYTPAYDAIYSTHDDKYGKKPITDRTIPDYLPVESIPGSILV